MIFKPIKHKEKNCDISCLPHNRKQAFFDIIKNNWRKLLICGLIILCCSLPLFLIFYFEIQTNVFYGQQLNAGLINEEDYLSKVYSNLNYSNLFLILGFALFILGVSTISRTYVKLCWQKGVILSLELKQSIKQNSLHNIIFSLLVSGGFFVSGFLFGVSNITQINIGILCFALLFIVVLIFLPMLFIFININSIYKDPFKLKFRNTFFVYSKTLIGSLIFLIIFLLPFCLFLIGSNKLMIVTTILYFLFYFPLCFLAYNLYIIKKLDEIINCKFYPEIVDLGIYR